MKEYTNVDCQNCFSINLTIVKDELICPICKKAGGLIATNFILPELQKLEEVTGQYDFLLQRGISYTMEEKERAYFLIDKIKKLVDQLSVK